MTTTTKPLELDIDVIDRLCALRARQLAIERTAEFNWSSKAEEAEFFDLQLNNVYRELRMLTGLDNHVATK